MRRTLAFIAALAGFLAPVQAAPLTCDLTGYEARPGLTAAVADETLTVVWNGAGADELQLRFVVDG